MVKTVITLAAMLVFNFSSLPGLGGRPSEELQEFRGVILNEQCYKRQPTWVPFAHEHSLACAMQPQCFLSGYHLVVDDQTVIKLDKRGELLARRILQTTKRQNNFQVVIQGRLSTSTLSVQTMQEAEPFR